MLVDTIQEFFELWDAFWKAGIGEGPTYEDLNAKALELKAEAGYIPPKKSAHTEIKFKPEAPGKKKR